MKKLLIIALLTLACNQYSSAQKLPACNADALMKRASNKDTTYIINFWATWCLPCVGELHAFDTLQSRYHDKSVKVLLVSFDFKEAYPKKILEFIKKKKVLPEVLWFSETNANEFIPKIEQQWSGSLPATLILGHNSFRWFHEGTINAAEISAIVDKQTGS
jgi:thiol-disulfide isomerase/thioredoxin